ncbi:hypothetical protein C8R44DRAFT_730101 [Mycena epipterygia]|nr:hypothetical protein C8R44DRAFT_730101 [Mycena epipterygia]
MGKAYVLLRRFSSRRDSVIVLSSAPPATMQSSISLPLSYMPRYNRLNDDVLDVIFHFLPTFSDLQAVILTSKSRYYVFRQHSRSIVFSVACNVLRSSWPPAMRLASHMCSSRFGEVCETPEALSTPIPRITPKEARALATNASVAEALEIFFSSRLKDKSSQASKLSVAESHRFRAAIYRIALFTRIFVPYLHSSYSSSIATPPLEKSQRKNFLLPLSSTELLQLRCCAHFLLDLAKWIVTESSSNDLDSQVAVENMMLAVGPAEILNAAQKMDSSFTSEYRGVYSDGYLLDSVDEILQEREIEIPADCFSSNCLLDVKEGIQYAIPQCPILPLMCRIARNAANALELVVLNPFRRQTLFESFNRRLIVYMPCLIQ